MSFSPTIIQTIATADARALATVGPQGINVIPISTCKVTNAHLWVFDFFMNKTVTNVQAEPHVAFSAWKNFTGVQIKAIAAYHTDEKSVATAQEWVSAQGQDRVVRGLITLTPTVVYDVTPGGAFSEADLAFS